MTDEAQGQSEAEERFLLSRDKPPVPPWIDVYLRAWVFSDVRDAIRDAIEQYDRDGLIQGIEAL